MFVGQFGAVMSCCLCVLFVCVGPALRGTGVCEPGCMRGAGRGRCCSWRKTEARNTEGPGLSRFVRMLSLNYWEAICLFRQRTLMYASFQSWHSVGLCASFDSRLSSGDVRVRWTRARRAMPISPARSPCGAAASRSSGRPGSRCRTTRSCRVSNRSGRRPASPPDVRASVRAWRPP